METPKVASAEVSKNFGQYADRALVASATITKHDREHLVQLSADEYRLKQRDRQVYRVEDMSTATCGPMNLRLAVMKASRTSPLQSYMRYPHQLTVSVSLLSPSRMRRQRPTKLQLKYQSRSNET